MSKIFKSRLFVCIAIISLTVIGASCEKDEKVNSVTRPQITALSNTQGLIGATITIMGTHLKSVDRVRFGAEEAANFNPASNTDSAITATVPAGVIPGDLLLTVYISGIGSDQTTFKVVEAPKAPVITAVTPATGTPGTEVTISGANLGIVTQVKFGDVVATFTATESSITTSVPETTVGGDQMITVLSPGGTTTFTFNVNLAPEISSFTPIKAQVDATVTITGKRFTNVQSVKIGSGNVPAYTVVSPTSITFTVPAGAATGKISVTTDNGTGTSSDNFTVDNSSFKYIIYDEALNADWQKWDGWGTSEQSLSSTEHPQNGTESIKISFNDGYGGFQLHPVTQPPMATLSTIKLSIYGGAGAVAGSKVVLYIKTAAGTGEDKKIELTLTPDAYTEFNIPLADVGNPADISEFNFQNWGTNPITIYVDDIGFN